MAGRTVFRDLSALVVSETRAGRDAAPGRRRMRPMRMLMAGDKQSPPGDGTGPRRALIGRLLGWLLRWP